MTTTMTSSLISTLPDLCLLTIFDSVPLFELPNVLLTCRRWHSLFRSILSRRTLTLQLGKPYHDENDIVEGINLNDKLDINRLTWHVLTDEHVVLLQSNLFAATNIGELILDDVYSTSTSSEYELEALTATVNNLMKLLPVCQNTKAIHTIALDSPLLYDMGVPLIGIIERISTLRVLKIDFSLLYKFISNKSPFPLLTQLHRLETSIGFTNNLIDFCRWIGDNYAHNDRLEIVFPLVFANIEPSLEMEDLEKIYRSGAPLSQFTGFFPEPSNFDIDQMKRFLRHFPRLTEFEVYINYRSLSEMSQIMSSLSHLSHLKLYHPCDEYDNNQDNNQQPPEPLPPQSYHPLPSVRQLTLCIDCHDEVEDLVWLDWWTNLLHATVFPNLKQLCIEIQDHNVSYGDEKYRIRHTLAMRHIAQPYLACAKLEVIVFKDTDYKASNYTCSYTPEQIKFN